MSTESDNPDIKWALDLLAPDPLYKENFISKYYNYITAPPVALGGVAYLNWFQGRPYYASIRRYGIAFVCSLIVAKVCKDAKTFRESERDAVMRHYIKLHPEDFPEPVRKTFNEDFQDWVPCR